MGKSIVVNLFLLAVSYQIKHAQEKLIPLLT